MDTNPLDLDPLVLEPNPFDSDLIPLQWKAEDSSCQDTSAWPSMVFGGIGHIRIPVWSVGYVPRRHNRARAGCQKPSRAGMSRSAATSRTALGPPGWLQPRSLLQERGAGVRLSHGMESFPGNPQSSFQCLKCPWEPEHPWEPSF